MKTNSSKNEFKYELILDENQKLNFKVNCICNALIRNLFIDINNYRIDNNLKPLSISLSKIKLNEFISFTRKKGYFEYGINYKDLELASSGVLKESVIQLCHEYENIGNKYYYIKKFDKNNMNTFYIENIKIDYNKKIIDINDKYGIGNINFLLSGKRINKENFWLSYGVFTYIENRFFVTIHVTEKQNKYRK